MTEKALRDLITHWQGRLGLGHWTIPVELSEDLERNGRSCVMMCHRSKYYDRATITVHPAVIGKGELPDSVEKDVLAATNDPDGFYAQVVVHELLHCTLRDLVEAGDRQRRLGRGVATRRRGHRRRAGQSTRSPLNRWRFA